MTNATDDAPSTAARCDSLLVAGSWQGLVLHDLREPLAVVTGQAQLLKRGLQKSTMLSRNDMLDVAWRLDQIVRSASRMAGMLDELQQLVGGIEPSLCRQHVDLTEIARIVLLDLHASQPEVPVELHAAAEPLVGFWDANRLERAIGNLVANAAKYTPDGGQVHVSLRREHSAKGESAVIAVRDTGVGIPAVDLPLIFEPFYRARNVSERFAGAGLGLAGVRHIVQLHGGSVSVTSREGKGSTFTVRLPLAREN